MKIAHVQVVPHLSGAQQVSLDILSSLNNSDNELFIICGELQDFSADFIDKFNKIGVKIIEVPLLKRELGRHDFYAFINLYQIFKKNKFDIIHTNSTKPAILARVAARLAGCNKIIHTVHGIAFHEYVPLSKRLLFYFVELFSLYFGHIQTSVNTFYTKYYPLVNTKIIYNGVDFSNLYPSKNLIEKDKIHFAFFGRLDEQKNPLDFIKAINFLKNEGFLNSRLSFSIAGDGELKNQCEQLIYEYNLQDDIKLLGWINDKSAFLNTVDVLCQPSKWEAFGLVFVEAAFFGIPSIATKVEGIPEVVLDGITGLLCDNNAVSLKNCMVKLIENSELIVQLGQNARSRALDNFSKQKMVEQYTKIYFDDNV